MYKKRKKIQFEKNKMDKIWKKNIKFNFKNIKIKIQILSKKKKTNNKKLIKIRKK